MIYNPLTKQLFTNNNEFLKQLHCPLQMQWHNLALADAGNKLCNGCNKTIINTEVLEENEVVNLLKENPHTCITINLNQENITINNFICYTQD